MDSYARGAHPSLKTIAKETGLSYATVNAQLRELELMGLLTIRRGGGKGHPNQYEGHIPPFVLVRLTDKQSDGWTLSAGNSLIGGANSPIGEPKQSNGLTGSIPRTRSFPIEGAKRDLEEEPKAADERLSRLKVAANPADDQELAEEEHIEGNAWCRCGCRGKAAADAS
jgi:DNA-binding transcriptional MocR family regulator